MTTRWIFNTLPTGELHIQFVTRGPDHVLALLVDPTLGAEEVSRVLFHLEQAAIAQANAPVESVTQRLGTHGTLTGSLSVHAADGTDITQPAAAAE